MVVRLRGLTALSGYWAFTSSVLRGRRSVAVKLVAAGTMSKAGVSCTLAQPSAAGMVCTLECVVPSTVV